ncbi:IclR family transcriptional regulator [Litchfieldella qijiaojingensis]|uniref:IclR family transcriptional regulator n=1 Tax=Litchfieldella qijiaojingensis TaxID=980347 RepID=A0ABQ2YTK6_9GAMM|nr:IclR family transcriptional regulator [Halomonas qijiaojingensis]GGX92185.1 IclR family transcriptional regulator [Halomonas qijiaojingensis]
MTSNRHPTAQGPSTLVHAMQVLQVTAACGYRGASIDDYLDAIDLSRPTIYRLLKGLKEQGFLRPSPIRGRYLLGYELLVLGAQAGNGAGLRDLARPRLLSLAQRLGDSFYLFARDGVNAVCLEVQNGDYPVGSFVRATGGRLPLGVGQASIALLAYLGESERKAILMHNASRLQSDYNISPTNVEVEIHHLLKTGYARGVEGSQLPEYTGLAIPILDHSGHPLGAMSCSMLKSRMTESHKQEVLESMQAEALEMVQQAHGLLYVE